MSITWTREEAALINKASTARAAVDYVLSKLGTEASDAEIVPHLEQVGVALIEITSELIERANERVKNAPQPDKSGE